jgi:hypothetical protein
VPVSIKPEDIAVLKEG